MDFGRKERRRRRPKSRGQSTECEMILLCPKASTEHKVDSLEDLFRRKELPEESRAAEKRQNQEDVFVSHSRRLHCLPYYRHNLLLYCTTTFFLANGHIPFSCWFQVDATKENQSNDGILS